MEEGGQGFSLLNTNSLFTYVLHNMCGCLPLLPKLQWISLWLCPHKPHTLLALALPSQTSYSTNRTRELKVYALERLYSLHLSQTIQPVCSIGMAGSLISGKSESSMEIDYIKITIEYYETHCSWLIPCRRLGSIAESHRGVILKIIFQINFECLRY